MNIIDYITKPWFAVVAFDKHIAHIVPDKLYIECQYRCINNKKLNLKNPKTFCDKQNWLKLYDKHSEWTDYVDKIKVKDIIRDKLGEDYCFPTLGIYDNYEDIDFNKLPDKFVIKCNHDSGSVKIITDKSKINHKEFSEFYKNKLKKNFFWKSREYPYKNVITKIFIEEYMTPDDQSDIEDYKFFCFNGKPEFLFVGTNRTSDLRFDFYDMDFNHMDIQNLHPNSDKIIKKPNNFEELKSVATTLAKGIKFVRIDLFSIKGKVYFGEYTFFHGGGIWPLNPPEYEIKYGDMIHMPIDEK